MKQFNSYVVVIVNNRFLERGWKSRFNLEQLCILVRQLNCPERLNGTLEGDTELIDRIADERSVTSVEELLPWMEEHEHPAMTMDPIF